MMRRYPAYRDSGVEWLGEVPEGWVVSKLSRAIDPRRQITYGIVQAGPHYEGGIPYIRPTDMTDESGVLDESKLMLTSPEIVAAYRRSEVRTGDLVCSIGPSFGKVMVIPESLNGANLTQGTARLAVTLSNNYPRFVFWFLRSAIAVNQWESAIGGATFRSLNLEPLAATRIALPPLPEQTAIAAFLDRETAKIDALVAEQRRLIDLLREKRQAVISHAVTRGLNPAAPMKPSGVDWLGDVPEGWSVEKLAYSLASPPCYGVLVPDSDPDGVPMLRINDLTAKALSPDRLVRISEQLSQEYKRTLVSAGDVVLSVVGTIGSARVIGDEMDGINLSRAIARIQPGARMTASYLVWFFQSSAFTHFVDLVCVGTAQRVLNMGDLSAVALALPPVDEQETMAAYLTEEVARYDDAVSTAEAAIALLQERRAALISAAVTGKIDVRDLVTTETEAA